MEQVTIIDVDWADVDAMGHVNSLALLRYMQTCRVNLCRRMGIMDHPVNPRVGPILASIQVKYLHPLFYPGKATVTTAVTGVRHTSFTLAQTITDAAGNIVAQESELIVYYDYAAGEKRPLPEGFVSRLNNEA